MVGSQWPNWSQTRWTSGWDSCFLNLSSATTNSVNLSSNSLKPSWTITISLFKSITNVVFFILSRCCAISDTIILCIFKNVSLSSSSALLLLYDVTNKASFDNIRVRTTLGLQLCLPYLSFLLSLSCFPFMSLTTLLKPLFRNHFHSFKSHLNMTICSWTKIVTSIWNVFRTTGVKKNPTWILMQQPSVKPWINFGHECWEINSEIGDISRQNEFFGSLILRDMR